MRWTMLLAMMCMLLTGHAAQASGARTVRIEAFASKQVAPRAVTIWLPAEYDRNRKRRFPVLYVQDGGDALGAQGLDIDGAITRLSGGGRVRPAIVVAVSSTALRQREYFPSKLYDLLPPDYRRSVDLVTRGAPLGDAYLAFLATELKPFIDRDYRTLPAAADTSVLGTSMGGLIAIYAMGEYPGTFGQAAGLSPYWPLGNPAGPPIGTPEGATMVVNVFATWLMRSKADPKRNRFYMDRGSAGLDSAFIPFTTALDSVMPGLGWKRGATWESRAFPGATHTTAAWRERIDAPLLFLLGN